MKLVGDEKGIAALKAEHKENPAFVKALLEDARSTTDHATTFRDKDGNRYKLTIDARTGEVVIAANPRLSTFPPPPEDE